MTTLKDAKEIADTIVKTIHPHTVVVLGSIAKYGRGNDVDILVVYDDKDAVTDSLYYGIINKHLKCFYKKFAIDPFIVLLSTLRISFRKGSHFLRLIQRDGMVLYI